MSCSLWKPDFSNVGKQQGGWFKRLVDKQGLAKCQLGRFVLFLLLSFLLMRQSLGVKRCLYHGGFGDPLVCSSPVCPSQQALHKHLAQDPTVESTRLFSKCEGFSGYKPHQSGSSDTCCAHSLRSPGCKPHAASPSPHPPTHLSHMTSRSALWVGDVLFFLSQVPQSRHS